MSEAPIHWRGRWIWAEEELPSRNAFVAFRRRFPCEGGQAVLHITADSRYVAWLNGACLGSDAFLRRPVEADRVPALGEAGLRVGLPRVLVLLAIAVPVEVVMNLVRLAGKVLEDVNLGPRLLEVADGLAEGGRLEPEGRPVAGLGLELHAALEVAIGPLVLALRGDHPCVVLLADLARGDHEVALAVEGHGLLDVHRVAPPPEAAVDPLRLVELRAVELVAPDEILVLGLRRLGPERNRGKSQRQCCRRPRRDSCPHRNGPPL